MLLIALLRHRPYARHHYKLDSLIFIGRIVLNMTQEKIGGLNIIKNPNICNGLWRVEGTRIPVIIIKIYKKSGFSNQDIKKEYPTLTLEQIQAAINFKYD